MICGVYDFVCVHDLLSIFLLIYFKQYIWVYYSEYVVTSNMIFVHGLYSIIWISYDWIMVTLDTGMQKYFYGKCVWQELIGDQCNIWFHPAYYTGRGNICSSGNLNAKKRENLCQRRIQQEASLDIVVAFSLALCTRNCWCSLESCLTQWSLAKSSACISSSDSSS